MKNKPNDKKLNIKLFDFLRDDRRKFFLLSVVGVLFNVGLVFIPVFEGWLVQCLFDIFNAEKVFYDMLKLVAVYLLVMLGVQVTRYYKRKFVRQIANNMVVRLRDSLYVGVLSKKRNELDNGVGELVTRASLDVEIVAEGTRKIIVAIYDIGVLLIAFAVTMFIYDPLIATIALLFTPIACIIAELLKKVVHGVVASYKKSGEVLASTTYDRVNNESLYRVFGRDKDKNVEYDGLLKDYEKKAVKASIWENSLQPIYNVISLIGVIFIIYLGGRNFLGIGFRLWDIAVFTTFISCYTKVAEKSSKVAGLFNSAQKAQVSWRRLKNNLSDRETVFPQINQEKPNQEVNLSFDNVSFGYVEDRDVLSGVSFSAKSGQIIGVTGAVASGKSALGKVFLGEFGYRGSISINGEELRLLDDVKRAENVSYLGHNSELFSDSIIENIGMGTEADITEFLKLVSIDDEIKEMPEGIDTPIGNFGIRLSGGQKARVALARTLLHAKSVIVLDDPFSAVDKPTENAIIEKLKNQFASSIIILISHRLTVFPSLDKVLWIEDGKLTETTHDALVSQNENYRSLYELQRGLDNV